MKRYALLAAAGGVIVAGLTPDTNGQGPQTPQTKAAGKVQGPSLDGTWTMVRGEQEGKPLSNDVVHGARLTIEGDKHTVKVGDVTIVGTHKLHPSHQPPAIDT